MGVRCVNDNDLSHHLPEDVAVHQEPAEKSEGTGRGGGGCSDSPHLTRRAPEGCLLTSGDSLLPRALKGPSQLYPPLSHKNPHESSAAAWKST